MTSRSSERIDAAISAYQEALLHGEGPLLVRSVEGRKALRAAIDAEIAAACQRARVGE